MSCQPHGRIQSCRSETPQNSSVAITHLLIIDNYLFPYIWKHDKQKKSWFFQHFTSSNSTKWFLSSNFKCSVFTQSGHRCCKIVWVAVLDILPHIVVNRKHLEYFEKLFLLRRINSFEKGYPGKVKVVLNYFRTWNIYWN